MYENEIKMKRLYFKAFEYDEFRLKVSLLWNLRAATKVMKNIDQKFDC